MTMLGQISSNQANQILLPLRNLSVEFGVRFLIAIVVLIVGRWVADTVKRLVKQAMVRTNIEPTLTSFACNILYYATLSFFVLAALGRLGIETTSLIAILGAAGLAVGLALQGSLSNFAAGILIILFHPFRSGDWVEVAGVSGIVEEIQIFTTVLRTWDNRTVIVPNSKLTNDNIINYSAKGILRVDLVIGVAYEENLANVKRFVQEVLTGYAHVLSDPKPTVGVLELADSSVNLAVRPWVRTEHYWDVYFGVQEALKTRFDEVGISIPFPQRDVHLTRENSENTP